MNRLTLALVLSLASTAASLPAHALSVSGTFSIRDHIGPNTVGSTAGDRLVLGATTVVPAGPPTTVTAEQAGTVLTPAFTPLTLFPALYAASVPFDAALAGEWQLTATRDAEVAGAVTNSIPEPRLIPLVGNLRVLGTGLTPTLAWALPDLTDMSVERIRVRVLDAGSGDQLSQFTVPNLCTGPGVESCTVMPSFASVPPGLLAYGRSYVFRVMLEDLVLPAGVIQNRSNTFSEPYTPVTAVALGSLTLFSDRGVFESQLGTTVTDDYSAPGYVGDPPRSATVLPDAAMSAVLGETQYTATSFPDFNLVVSIAGDFVYCSGCNGSFRLTFTDTSVGDGAGVFGAGFDVSRIIHSFVFRENPSAFVTLGDGTTASIPLTRGFFGIAAGAHVRSIHIGRPDGSAGGSYIEIDDLTIGSEPAIGVAIDIKPGDFPNTINLGSHGTVPVAILGSSAFDVQDVVVASIRLAGAPVAANVQGRPRAHVADVNGDGMPDLVVHIDTAALALTGEATEAVLDGQTAAGATFRGVDSVRILAPGH